MVKPRLEWQRPEFIVGQRLVLEQEPLKDFTGTYDRSPIKYVDDLKSFAFVWEGCEPIKVDLMDFVSLRIFFLIYPSNFDFLTCFISSLDLDLY